MGYTLKRNPAKAEYVYSLLKFNYDFKNGLYKRYLRILSKDYRVVKKFDLDVYYYVLVDQDLLIFLKKHHKN